MQSDDDSNQSPDKSLSQQWKGFKFFCGDSGKELNQNSTVPNFVESDKVIRLSQVRAGETVLIIEIVSISCVEDLREMGFVPGVSIQIVSRTTTGYVIVLLQNQRIGLGKDMAKNILVRGIS